MSKWNSYLGPYFVYIVDWHVEIHNIETAVDTSNPCKFFIQFFILKVVSTGSIFSLEDDNFIFIAFVRYFSLVFKEQCVA